MPAANALVVIAEFRPNAQLVPGLAGSVIKPGEAKRLGQAMLRDTIEKAHHCAGLEPLVAYFPPNRRGEVEEALGGLDVWAEPLSGATEGHRVAHLLRNMLEERAFRTAIALSPSVPHLPRQRIFDAVHRLREKADLVVGRTPDGQVGLLGVREMVPDDLAPSLDSDFAADAVERELGPRRRFVRLDIPTALTNEHELAHAIFDVRADLATRRAAGHDVPLHTLELFSALGFDLELRRSGEIHLRRAGPPNLAGA